MTYRVKGFTLMELMLVMSLVMILSLIGVGAYTQATVKSKDTQRKGEIAQMVRAVESFYQDVGRYPFSSSQNTIRCYAKNGSDSATDEDCLGSPPKLYSRIDGVVTNYITIPYGPDYPLTKYIYVSDGAGFSFYAALENGSDKDLIKNADGTTYTYAMDCGSLKCNYKVTEEGLIKAI